MNCIPPYPFLFQSTLPVWGGTAWAASYISAVRISIHPPRVGRDPCPVRSHSSLTSFQSTLPVWGGTHRGQPEQGHRVHFNPPSPCGEGHLVEVCMVLGDDISIHPPRVGRDRKTHGLPSVQNGFQSTLPVWGGTFRSNDTFQATLVFQSTLPVWGGTS